MGMGLGFTMALTILGAIREILGSGSIFGWKFIAGDGMIVFVLAPGAFLVLGYLIVFVNRINKKGA
jgi:Na+-translocating ferredoxin:NAD+ oxidoreductase subunit E